MLEFDVRLRSVPTFPRILAAQLPFIAAKAVNLTAEDAQAEQRRHQRSVFTVRRPTFVDRAVKISKFAKKADPSATMRIEPPGGIERADILAKFEQAGVKRPLEGHSLAIPVDVRPTRGGIIPSRLRPKAFKFQRMGRGPKATVYRGEGRTFLIKYHDATTGGIYQRVRHNRGKRRRARLRELGRDPGIRTLYRFTGRSTIDARLRFVENVRGVVHANFARHWSEAMEFALRTGKSAADYEVRRIARADVFNEGRVSSYRGEVE